MQALSTRSLVLGCLITAAALVDADYPGVIRNEKTKFPAADPEPTQEASMYPELRLNPEEPKYDEPENPDDSKHPEEPVYETTGNDNMDSGSRKLSAKTRKVLPILAKLQNKYTGLKEEARQQLLEKADIYRQKFQSVIETIDSKTAKSYGLDISLLKKILGLDVDNEIPDQRAAGTQKEREPVYESKYEERRPTPDYNNIKEQEQEDYSSVEELAGMEPVSAEEYIKLHKEQWNTGVYQQELPYIPFPEHGVPRPVLPYKNPNNYVASFFYNPLNQVLKPSVNLPDHPPRFPVILPNRPSDQPPQYPVPEYTAPVYRPRYQVLEPVYPPVAKPAPSEPMKAKERLEGKDQYKDNVYYNTALSGMEPVNPWEYTKLMKERFVSSMYKHTLPDIPFPEHGIPRPTPQPYKNPNNYVASFFYNPLNHMLKQSIDLPDHQSRFPVVLPNTIQPQPAELKPSYSEHRALFTEPRPVQLEPRNTPRPLHPESSLVYPEPNYRALAESIYPEPKPFQARHVHYNPQSVETTPGRVAYDYSPVEYRSTDYRPRTVVYNANQRVEYITDYYNSRREYVRPRARPAEYNFRRPNPVKYRPSMEETFPRPVEYNRRGSNVAQYKPRPARIRSLPSRNYGL